MNKNNTDIKKVLEDLGINGDKIIILDDSEGPTHIERLVKSYVNKAMDKYKEEESVKKSEEEILKLKFELNQKDDEINHLKSENKILKSKLVDVRNGLTLEKNKNEHLKNLLCEKNNKIEKRMKQLEEAEKRKNLEKFLPKPEIIRESIFKKSRKR